MGLFFSCKEASQQVLMAEDKKLSRVAAIKLAIHMNLCKVCRSFAHQSTMITTALKTEGPALKLDPEFKEELNRLIAENSR